MMSLDASFETISHASNMEQYISYEFPTLKDMCYLDHTGTTLYAKSQIESVFKELTQNTFGNPHSHSLSSKYTSDLIDQTRCRILRHFHTNSEEYSVIFTSSATSALKIIAESFDWKTETYDKKSKSDVKAVDDAAFTFINQDTESINQRQQNGEKCMCTGKSPLLCSDVNKKHGAFVYLQDNHTSVLGMRELAVQKGACVHYMSHDLAFSLLSKQDASPCNNEDLPTSSNSLFVYPAQCNFSGVKFPLEWINKVQSGALYCNNSTCCHNSKWFCLLDAASYVSTNDLNLTLIKPDFVCISFYKIFGYPTGIGALLVKTSSAHTLIKHYFGGGTVQVSLSGEKFHELRSTLHERFEDGTVPFLSIIALGHGFNALTRLTKSMVDISMYTLSLARYVHHHLLLMHHSNGTPVVKLYTDTDYEDYTTQGNIVNFNIQWSNGEYVGFVEVLHMANLHNIHIRTGCFCNPGACQRHLKLSTNELRSHFQAGHICGDEMDLIDGQPTGSIRISFGYMSTKHDADKFLTMISSCFVDGPMIKKLPLWWPAFQNTYRQKFNMKDEKKSFKTNTIFSSTKVCDGLTDNIIENKYQNITELDTNTSNIEDKYASQKSKEMYPVDNTKISNKQMILTHIFLYPIKSCGAMSVRTWELGTQGLLYDREWMIVSSAGVALTQKQESKLCMIKPAIDLDKKCLILNCEGYCPISVSLSYPQTNHLDVEASLCHSKVCGDYVQGWDCGDEVAEWLSFVLSRDGLRLLRQWKSSRGSKFKTPLDSVNLQPTISLSNQAQFLLINTASVDWLFTELKDINLKKNNLLERFRCNLVAKGSDPFEENNWKSLQIGEGEFHVEGPCTRCQMICIDQTTGQKTKEPLRTLSLAFHGKMRFGIYLHYLQQGSGILKLCVGNEIKLL